MTNKYQISESPSGTPVRGSAGQVLVANADGTWSPGTVPGGSLPPVSSADNGDVLTVVAGVWAKSSPGFAITSFVHTPTLVLLGTAVATPAFTAAYSGFPDTAILTDNQGSSPEDVSLTPTAFSSLGTFTKTVFGQSATFFLNASKAGVSAAQASVSITWGQPNYSGSAVDPGGAGYTQAFIKSLTASGVAVSPNGTYAANNPTGQSEFFATRTAYGLTALNFTVNGLPFAISKVASAVAVTNVQGVTENYDLWRSDNTGLGAYNFVVG